LRLFEAPVGWHALTIGKGGETIMTMARKHLVDVEMTRYYHCISRCVRRAFLCGEGFEHRKDWIEARLQELAGIFSVDVERLFQK